MFEGQVKLIYHNAGRVKEPDDPSYPYRLECNFGPPELMAVTFVMLYGGSELIVLKGKTVEVLKEVVAAEKFAAYFRLRRMKIRDANDKVLWSLQGRLMGGDCQWYEGDVDQNPPFAPRMVRKS